MAYQANFPVDAPARAEIDALPGPLLLEFGVDWCPHCQRAQAPLANVLAGHPALTHLKVEDGPGRPLGRSFRVKLWPTLILLRGGVELGRLIRPTTAGEIRDLLDRLATP